MCLFRTFPAICVEASERNLEEAEVHARSSLGLKELVLLIELTELISNVSARKKKLSGAVDGSPLNMIN